VKGVLKYFVVCSVLFFPLAMVAQDTVKVAKDKKKIYRHARIATIMSAAIPGAGQFYNRKYWKPPIIYAGLAGFGYMLVKNQNEYQKYSSYLKAENDGDPNTINPTKYNSDQLLGLKVQYRKNRDIGIIGLTIMYLVNIVDANVDAHLKTFDVSDDLSLNNKPYGNFARTSPYSLGFQGGVCIQLNFK
jgi:hypothetical protein